MKTLLVFLTLSLPLFSHSQTLPYSELPPYPDDYTAGRVAARAVDGLGFRFYWATEGLRESDLSHKPGPDARTSLETVAHIYEMSFIIVNASLKKINVEGQDIKLPFAEMRKRTLENLKTASDILRKSSDNEVKEYKAMFSRGGKVVERPFWNLLSGPIEDCVWHTGQVVSFRRASGNPFSEKVNLFAGTVSK